MTRRAARYLVDTFKGADLGGDEDGPVLEFNYAYDFLLRLRPDLELPLAPRGLAGDPHRGR